MAQSDEKVKTIPTVMLRVFVLVLLALSCPMRCDAKPLWRRAYEAAEKGDVATIRKILKKKSNVTYCSAAAHAAAEKGNMEIVTLLLDAGLGYPKGLVASAASSGNIAMVTYLMQRFPTSAGDLPQALNAAASGGHKELVVMLLARNAQVTTWCLEAATKKGYLDIVQLLLARDVEVTAECLVAAAEQGHLEIVELLVPRVADIDRSRDAIAITKVQQDALYGTVYTIDWKAGVGPNPLSTAIENRHADVVRYLVAHGADVRRKVVVKSPAIKKGALGLFYGIEDSLRGRFEANLGGKRVFVEATPPRIVTNAAIDEQEELTMLDLARRCGDASIIELIENRLRSGTEPATTENLDSGGE